MPRLSIERIFSDPDLSGSIPTAIRFSPDGSLVSYLKAASSDYERLDLWVLDVESGTTRLLVDSDRLIEGATAKRELSDEEKARRERKRITHSGIVEYFWHPDSRRLLFPMEGILYLHDSESGETSKLTADDIFATDVAFSPDGTHVSWVSGKNLYARRLADGQVYQLTHDGSDTIANGLAEFIAQEEMHRFEGYWWSPDSQRIAFTRVDESPVAVTQRYEIDADSFTVFDQRYPYAGTANALVQVGVVSLTGDTTWLTIPDAAPDASYIARVNWFDTSDALAIQVQPRHQQSLALYRIEADNSNHTLLLTETSETWINLNDSFRSIPGKGFLWGSERSGYHHLYLVSPDGHSVTPLTRGDWVVTRVCGVCEETSRVYFQGYRDTVLENHLYCVSLDGHAAPVQLTEPGATHDTVLSADRHFFIDRYSSALQPPSVAIRRTASAVVGKDDAFMLFANALDADHPFHPYLTERGEVSFGTLAAEDGQALQYRLIKPAGASAKNPCPVIVTVYGGPGVQRVSNEWIAPWHHYMASRGFALLQLDNRGSANRGRAFEAPIYHRMGDAEVNDQLAGVQFLQSLPFIDGSRIGVFGHSYGGYMTLMLMAKSPGTFCAGVSVAPVSDWRLYDTHYTERFLGLPDAGDAYETSSVFPYLPNMSGALLLIHGMADDNVLFTHSTKLYKFLQDRNIAFEMMNYPGAKHGISGRKANIHRYSTMDRFFEQHLTEGQHTP